MLFSSTSVHRVSVKLHANFAEGYISPTFEVEVTVVVTFFLETHPPTRIHDVTTRETVAVI
jgi:hypothetical protein